MGKKNKVTRKAVDRLLLHLLAWPPPPPADGPPGSLHPADRERARELRARLEANPGDAQVKFDLGLLYFWAAPDKAKQFLDDACAGQADNALRWLALMCFHVVRWRVSHRSEETLAAWTIVQRNRSLLWSVASPKLLHFFGLVFKFHGDFDRAFKLAHEFVLRHPDKPFTRVMARLGAEVSFAHNRHGECMKLLEMLTIDLPPPSVPVDLGSGGGLAANPELDGLFMLQGRMCEVAASGGRTPVNRGMSFRRRLPEEELGRVYMEAWRRSNDFARLNPATAASAPMSHAGGDAADPATVADRGPRRSFVSAPAKGGSERTPPTPKQTSRRVLSWIGDPATWWAQVRLHYERDEHFFAESFVQGFLCTLLESSKGKKLRHVHMTAEQFLTCAEIYLAIDNVPVALEFGEVALKLSEADHFAAGVMLDVQKFLAKVSPEWAHAHATAERLTIRLQRFWRARRKHKEFKVKKKHVTKLQAVFRGSAARRQVHRKSQHRAALNLQRQFRGSQARQVAREYKKEQKATQIAAWVRAAKVRRGQRHLYNTAALIQALMRRRLAKGIAADQRRRWHAGVLKVAKCCVNYCHDARRLAFEVWRLRTPPLVRAVASLLRLPQPPAPAHVKTIHLVQVDETEADAVNPEDATLGDLRDPVLSTHGTAHARRLGLRWSVAVSQGRHRWPDLVLASPHARALQTACLVFKQAGAVAAAAAASSSSSSAPSGRPARARRGPTSAIVAHPALCDFRGKGSSKGSARRRGGGGAGAAGRFGVDCVGVERKKGLLARKGRGAVAAAAAAAAPGGVGEQQLAAAGGAVVTRDDLLEVRMQVREVPELMADRRLMRLSRFSHVDFGLLAPGQWWCDTTFSGPPPQAAVTAAMSAAAVGAGRQGRAALVKRMSYAPGGAKGGHARTNSDMRATSATSRAAEHRRVASMAAGDGAGAAAAAAAGAAAAAAAAAFFTFPTGIKRVKKFVAWLASRPERHVSVVTDRPVIEALLRLRQHHEAAAAGAAEGGDRKGRGGNNGAKRSGSAHSSRDQVRDHAHDVEVLTDLLSEVYDCCQTYDCYSFDNVLLEKVDVLERMAALQTRWWQRKAWIFARDQSMTTLLRDRLVQRGVAKVGSADAAAGAGGGTPRKRSLQHPEPIDVTSNALQPAAEMSPGETCSATVAARLPAVLAFTRPSDTRKELVLLFDQLDGAVTKNRKQLTKLREQGRAQFDALEAAMAAVWDEVTEADLTGIRAEKYIPDLLRDVFGGVMILFGHTGHHSFDTPAVQRFFGTKNLRDRIANCDFKRVAASTQSFAAAGKSSPKKSQQQQQRRGHAKLERHGRANGDHDDDGGGGGGGHEVDDEVKGIIHILFGEGGSEYDHLASIHRPPKRVHRLIGGYLKERWISFDDRNLTTMLDRRGMPQFSAAVPIARWVTAVYEFWLAIPGYIVEILSLERNTHAVHEQQMEILAHFVDYSTTDADGRMCEPKELQTYGRMQAVMLRHVQEDEATHAQLHPSSPPPKFVGTEGDECEQGRGFGAGAGGGGNNNDDDDDDDCGRKAVAVAPSSSGRSISSDEGTPPASGKAPPGRRKAPFTVPEDGPEASPAETAAAAAGAGGDATARRPAQSSAAAAAAAAAGNKGSAPAHAAVAAAEKPIGDGEEENADAGGGEGVADKGKGTAAPGFIMKRSDEVALL